jgi:3-Oxoacyl-[acyl-carrier-protein (ACP)] synthase III C terminal
MVAQLIGLPPEKMHNNIQKYGNTTAASIPRSGDRASGGGDGAEIRLNQQDQDRVGVRASDGGLELGLELGDTAA